VGVVADVRESRLDAEARIHTYTPYLQLPPDVVANEIIGFGMLRGLHLAVWTAGDPTLLVEPVRREIQRLDPALAIANVQTMKQQVARAAAPQRASATLLGLFAGAALLMAAVGLYGLLAYGWRSGAVKSVSGWPLAPNRCRSSAWSSHKASDSSATAWRWA
jgi:putative ABC transport system permease protein